MILTSPLFMRVIIICGVPASFVVNVLLAGELPTFGVPIVLRVLGAFFIIVGFAWFTWGKSREYKKKSYEEASSKEISNSENITSSNNSINISGD